jgi:BlaI family transcriptional regulator, penicillinase repressor
MAKRKAKPKTQGAKRSLTDVEWDIMDVLWEHEPCAAGTVQEALEEPRGWAYSTVKTTMDRMVVKGLLATHAVRNLNLYTSLISRQEARKHELRNCLHRAFDGALTPMIQFLVEEEDLSAAELKELRQLIQHSQRNK